MTFEKSYPAYPFSELVRLSVSLAARFARKPAAVPANQDAQLQTKRDLADAA